MDLQQKLQYFSAWDLRNLKEVYDENRKKKGR